LRSNCPVRRRAAASRCRYAASGQTARKEAIALTGIRPGIRRGAATATAVLAALLCAGCGWFGGGHSGTTSESVFSARPGQCFQAPAKVQAQLSSLQRTPCSTPHTREAYAIVQYTASGSGGGSASPAGGAYPGSDALSTFAQGACAQHFGSYVGVDYLDSSLFFTYLLPSARSWESDDDRSVICFVTTAGAKITGSVKGSKK
jgi:hypothetical protein